MDFICDVGVLDMMATGYLFLEECHGPYMRMVKRLVGGTNWGQS